MRVHSLPWRLSTKTKLPVEYIKQTRRGGRKEPLGGRKWSVDRIWFSVGSVFGPRGAHPDVCKLASVARRHAVDSDVFPPDKIKRRQLSAKDAAVLCTPFFELDQLVILRAPLETQSFANLQAASASR